MTVEKEKKCKEIKPSLGGVVIDENAYKQDFDLTKLYQDYSSELLKVSLAGIAVVGFIIKELKLLEEGFWIKTFVGIGIILLAISAGFALWHRYLSTDSMAYYFAYLRADKLLTANEKLTGNEKNCLENQRDKEIKGFINEIKSCDNYLRAAVKIIIAGFSAIVIGIVGLFI